MNPLKDLETIYRDAVREVDPHGLISRCVKRRGGTVAIEAPGAAVSEDLSRFSRVLLTGMGKASPRMAQAMEAVLGSDLTDGLVITRYGQALGLARTRVLEAGHPLPDRGSLEGARELVSMAEAADSSTLVLNLVSGGGSALFCLPAEGISLEDKIETTRVLLASGAPIDEVNCVRKHLSVVKGGGFARIAYPARVISLILSDVIGDRIDSIASGITAPDPTTFGDALSIMEKYSILGKVPAAVSRRIGKGARGDLPETPKPGDRVFESVSNIIVGSNAIMCEAALGSARRLGYDVRLLTTEMTGEAKAAGGFFADIASEIASGRSCMQRPALVVAGGEPTVTLRGSGKGGRNQETALAFCLSCTPRDRRRRAIYFLSAGTDGSDGPTDCGRRLRDARAQWTRRRRIGMRHPDTSTTTTPTTSSGTNDLLFRTGPTPHQCLRPGALTRDVNRTSGPGEKGIRRQPPRRFEVRFRGIKVSASGLRQAYIGDGSAFPERICGPVPNYARPQFALPSTWYSRSRQRHA
jgi:hydroxypyruvate reductase